MKSLSQNLNSYRAILSFALLITISISYSQEAKVTIEDLQLEYYEKDSSAGAVFLFDIGTVDLDMVYDEFKMKYTRHARIKFFNESEMEWANVVVPFYFEKIGNKEEIKITKAITYNLVNGKIEKTTLNKSDYIEEETTGYYKQIKFAFSNVRPGSIVEFEYELLSPFKYRPRTWYFQYSIPVLYSEYQAEFASFWHYKTLLQSHETPIIDTTFIKKNVNTAAFTDRMGKYINYQYSKAITKLAYGDVPALHFEENMKCKEDYISKLEFQILKYEVPQLHEEIILKTWNDVASELYDKFGLSDKVKMSRDLEDKLSDQTLTSEEKTKIILSYVQKKYAWNGENSINSEQNSKELQESRNGNSADLNLHLIRLLKQNGIDVYPIILSTSSHGRLYYEIPFIKQFNYIIPLIADDKGVFFCDATLNCAPYYLIPSKCLNGHGFLVDKKQAQFIELMDISQTQSLYNAVGRFNSTMDTLTMQINLKAYGYDAVTLREYLLADDVESIKEKIFPNETNVQVEYNRKIEEEDYNTSLSLNFTIKKKTIVREDKVYFNPFVCENHVENPFRSKEREYPIDFRYKTKKKISVSIELPQDYMLASQAKDTDYSLPNNGVKFVFKTQANTRLLQAISEYEVTSPAIKAEEYTKLKELYDVMIRSHSEYFVISKTESVSMK